MGGAVIGGTQRGAAWLSWLHVKRLVVGVGRYKAVENHTEAAPGGCQCDQERVIVQGEGMEITAPPRAWSREVEVRNPAEETTAAGRDRCAKACLRGQAPCSC